MRPPPLTSSKAILTAAILCGSPAQAAPVPDRVWGSYVNAHNPMYYSTLRVATDGAGNVFVAGLTSATVNIATSGAHKEQPESEDGFLIKLDPAGERLWGTYVGGAGPDRVQAIDVEGDTIVVAGSTGSTDGIASPGSFQPTYTVDEGAVGFVAAFSTAGVWQWGTYLQADGSPIDQPAPRSVAIGPQDTVDVGGHTIADAGLATPGAHQTSPSGKKDAFVARLGPQGELVWGTYYGGGDDDEGEGIAVDGAGGTYLVGNARSIAGIASPGAFQPALGGGVDMFLARFTAGGALDWGTYLGGPGADLGHAVAVHPTGGVAMVGWISAPGFATPGTHQQDLKGATDGALIRFDAAGTRLWSTYFGGEKSDYAYAVDVDPLGAIVFSGYTLSTTGVATPNSFQTMLLGSPQTFAAKFDDTGNAHWATYYGTLTDEQSFSVAAAGPERVILAGHTDAAAGIATPDGFMWESLGTAHGFVVAFTDVPAKACQTNRGCASGHCVDGVCCDTACGDGADDCQACSVAGGGLLDGHCSPGAPGLPCGDATGVCDAADVCTEHSRLCPDADLPDGTECPDGVCVDGQCAPPPQDTTTGDATDGTTTADMTEGTGTSTGGSTATGEATSDGGTTSDGSATDAATTTASTSGPDTDPGAPETGSPGSTSDGSSPDPTAAATGSDSVAPPTSTDVASSNGDGPGGSGDEDTTDDGCGCRTTSSAPGLLVAFTLLPRRRRSSTRPEPATSSAWPSRRAS